MIRLCDIIFSLLGIIILSPLFIFTYISIILESKGGGFFLQKRVGKKGVDFYLYKFRSMKLGSDQKSLITIGNRDPRVTKVGHFIRKYKIDELPQLINVIRGDMSLVGPRPEVRKYVDCYTKEEQHIVLSIKPGITDYASIEYADENNILSKSVNPEKVYIEEIIPQKIILNKKYITKYNIFEYFKIIMLTVLKIFS